ncbi:MAG: hypothetical protein J6V44_16735 [Methanobrevibacter sp.]|nr:hypothetical protein [Methanobrevibacter sp.]MBO7691949.1 hypothetical protein [Methanobrevibacter sp.]
MEKKIIEIDSHVLCRMMVVNLRYCYTRNNHLEPTCTYDLFKEELLPAFFEKDEETALHTAKQICEECISDEICTRFFEGEDDEFDNREYSIKFVNYLLDLIHEYDEYYKPYNFDSFLKNLEHDNDKIYQIYEEDIDKNKTLVTEKNFSKKEYFDYIFKDVLKLTEEELKKGVYYNKKRIRNSYLDDKTGKYVHVPDDFKYAIKEPINRVFYIKNIRGEKNE